MSTHKLIHVQMPVFYSLIKQANRNGRWVLLVCVICERVRMRVVLHAQCNSDVCVRKMWLDYLHQKCLLKKGLMLLYTHHAHV